MAPPNAPRRGSLQYWPRKRARKILPSPNWKAIKSNSAKLEGFICYKAGMASAYVKDETPDSMTKGKKIIVPVTIIECPPLKIFSVRFYKNGKVAKDVLSESLDKELKRTVRLPKTNKKEDLSGDYEDVRLLCYSVVKKTNIKKTPDLSEIALGGSYEDKIKFIKENLGKEILVSNIFDKGNYFVKNDSGKFKATFVPADKNGFSFLKIGEPVNGKDKVSFIVPIFGDITKMKAGQKIIVLGSSIASFIFDGSKDLKLNGAKSNAGAPILDLDGNILGIALSGDSSFVPIGNVTDALKSLKA